MRKPLIAGHRGAAARAPENTLPSFRKALDLGVSTVELDVRLTADGVAVCFHDDRLDRLTSGRGAVAEWGWERLSELAVLPGAFGGAYPDARIPLLSAVLRELPPATRFLIEMKAEPARPDELVGRMLEIVREADAATRCRFISFEPDLLARLRAAASTAGQPAPLGVIAGPSGRDALLPRARELQAEAVHPHHSLVNAELMRAAAEGEFQVNVWTANTAELVRRLADLGVDEITTDDPEIALRALDAR